MEVREALKTRRSIRSFKETPVPAPVLEEILELATLAPTSCNRQLWKFIVVDKPTFQQELEDVCPTIAVIDAPIVVFILYDRRYNREHHANAQSAAAAAMYICLAAHDMGLASLWMAGYGDEKGIKRRLAIPEEYEIMSAVTLGYPAESHSTPAKRPAERVVCYNSFSGDGPLPFSWKPSDWTLDQLANVLQYAVRAKSPSEKFYRPTSESEFQTEIELIPSLRGKTLLFGPFSGNHLFELIRRGKVTEVSVASYGSEINQYLEDKRCHSGIEKSIDYLVFDGSIPTGPSSFDHIICAFQLERMPDPHAVADEFCRVLRLGGRLFLFVANSRSIHYCLWVWKQAIMSFIDKKLLRFRLMIPNASMALRGPFRPLPWRSLRRCLHRFEVERVYGIGRGPVPLGSLSPRSLLGVQPLSKHVLVQLRVAEANSRTSGGAAATREGQ